jgi:hypothetical protein
LLLSVDIVISTNFLRGLELDETWNFHDRSFCFFCMKDNLFDLFAYKKLAEQLIEYLFLINWGGIRITSFFGMFSVADIGIVESDFFSIVGMVVVTNSYN